MSVEQNTVIYGSALFVAVGLMSTAILLFGRWFDRYLELITTHHKRIGFRMLGSLWLNSIPCALAVVYIVYYYYDPLWRHPPIVPIIAMSYAILWPITAAVLTVIYSRGELKYFWYQITDPASWGALPFPYGRRARTIKEGIRLGFLDTRFPGYHGEKQTARFG